MLTLKPYVTVFGLIMLATCIILLPEEVTPTLTNVALRRPVTQSGTRHLYVNHSVDGDLCSAYNCCAIAVVPEENSHTQVPWWFVQLDSPLPIVSVAVTVPTMVILRPYGASVKVGNISDNGGSSMFSTFTQCGVIRNTPSMQNLTVLIQCSNGSLYGENVAVIGLHGPLMHLCEVQVFIEGTKGMTNRAGTEGTTTAEVLKNSSIRATGETTKAIDIGGMTTTVMRPNRGMAVPVGVLGGVGAAAGVVVLIAIVVILYFCKRRQKKDEDQNISGMEPTYTTENQYDTKKDTWTPEAQTNTTTETEGGYTSAEDLNVVPSKSDKRQPNETVPEDAGVNVLYAEVDKDKKKAQRASSDDTPHNIADLYAVPDKTKKTSFKNIQNDSPSLYYNIRPV